MFSRAAQNLVETVLAVTYAHPKYAQEVLFMLFAIVPVFDAIDNVLASRTATKWD
eukprot:COSAG06_NODE_58020_length_278_cov_0.849162_1_plen_54_part_10